MSIGETLAQARRRAGLTVAQVSQRTRIRETIISGIEQDDYSACRGDFYARGDIRSIAHAVGADPEPLIREYDATQQADHEITAAEAFRPVRPARPYERQPRAVNWTIVLGLALLVALGVGGYFLLSSGSGHSPGTAAAHRNGPGGQAGTAASHPAASTSPAHAYAHQVVVRLTAIRGSRVQFTTPGGHLMWRTHVLAGTSRSWTFRRAVDMTLSNPGGVKLTVDGKNPLPSGTTAQPLTLSLGPHRAVAIIQTPPAAQVRRLRPASAVAFGPGGPGHGDDPQDASLAIDSSQVTAWHTDWYATARFGNLQAGTGLLLDMGRPVTVTRATITLGRVAGASLQLRAGDTPALGSLRPVARAAGAGGTVHLRAQPTARGRYLLIWFTRLPPDQAGTFEVFVRNVLLEGRR